MKRHTKVYMDHFMYSIGDFMQCELTGVKANDIHHIECRGMGGSTSSDEIDNLMALDRYIHIIYGDHTKYIDFLKEAHQSFCIKERPYIEVNPIHECFDVLIGTEFDSLLFHNRHMYSELVRYKV